MKECKFSNGIIDINGHKIPYDISYDELKGLFGAHNGYNIYIGKAKLYGLECDRIIIKLDFELKIKEVFIEAKYDFDELKEWLNNNIGMPNSQWTKNETTWDGDEEIVWDEEGIKYDLLNIHDVEMELKFISWNNEYLENGTEFYIEYNRGVKYTNYDSRRHYIEKK